MPYLIVDHQQNDQKGWIASEALGTLLQSGACIEILEERDCLPVFFGNYFLDKSQICEELTCACLALYGDDVKAIVYIGFNCSRHLVALDRDVIENFFEFGQWEGKDFVWAAIKDLKTVETLFLDIYNRDAELLAWLQKEILDRRDTH